MPMKHKLLLSLLALLPWTMNAEWVKLEPQRLPDLNIPRFSHHTILVNGTVYVFGGHTKGFIPTPTAEYYENGEWHTLPMVYEHDHALCVPMRSGKVLLAGGNEKPLGIGHTFVLELFDPETRTFKGYGCLEKKRFFANGAELADGTVIITGNSHHTDGIERFDGSRQNKFVKDVIQSRVAPFIFPIAADNALIFSGTDGYQQIRKDPIITELLKGDTLHVPLFEEWRPLSYLLISNEWLYSSIGDEAAGLYAYLFPVVSVKNGQVAMAKVNGTDIQLLPTESPIPMQSQWGPIEWTGSIVADREAHLAYLMGRDDSYRYFIACVDYTQEPAPLQLYYTDPHDDTGFTKPILTSDGNLVLAGGVRDNNFEPFATVLLFQMRNGEDSILETSSCLWPWLLGGLFFVAVVIGILLWQRGCRVKNERRPSETSDSIETEPLMASICQLMEEQLVYLNTDLKVADVASVLDVSSRTVSDCIKNDRGLAFAQFVNAYRIEHAKRLLQSEPDMKVSAVALQSGFANETSFFRSFKAHVGMTPREWAEQQKK